MSHPHSDLRKFALLLKNANPEAFDAFLAECDKRAYGITVAVTNAPSEKILVIQGQAQEALAFIRILKECHIQPNSKPTP